MSLFNSISLALSHCYKILLPVDYLPCGLLFMLETFHVPLHLRAFKYTHTHTRGLQPLILSLGF